MNLAVLEKTSARIPVSSCAGARKWEVNVQIEFRDEFILKKFFGRIKNGLLHLGDLKNHSYRIRCFPVYTPPLHFFEICHKKVKSLQCHQINTGSNEIFYNCG